MEDLMYLVDRIDLRGNAIPNIRCNEYSPRKEYGWDDNCDCGPYGDCICTDCNSGDDCN